MSANDSGKGEIKKEGLDPNGDPGGILGCLFAGVETLCSMFDQVLDETFFNPEEEHYKSQN